MPASPPRLDRARILGGALAVSAVLACEPPPIPPPPPPPRVVHAVAAAERVFTATGKPELVVQVTGTLDLAELSPDGVLLATAAKNERAVDIWDVDRHAVVAELGMLPGLVRALRWEAGGRWLLTVGNMGSVLYDGRTGRALANAPSDACAVLTSPPELVFVSEHDKGLAAVPFDGRGSFAAAIPEPPSSLLAAGGSRVLVSFDDHTEVRAPDLSLVAKIAAAGKAVPSADGAFAIIEHRVADLANGKLVLSVAAFDRGLAWSPHGHALAYGDESSLHVWTGPGSAAPVLHVASPITAIAWSPDERSVAFIDLSNHVFVAPVLGGPARLVGVSKTAGELAFSPDGKKLTVSWDTLAIWDVARGELEATLPSRACRIDWAATHGPRAVCPTRGAAGTPTVLDVRRLGVAAPESSTHAAIDGRDVGYTWHEDERKRSRRRAPDGSAAFLALRRGAPRTCSSAKPRSRALRQRALAGRKPPSEVHFDIGRDAIAAVGNATLDVWDRGSGAKRFGGTLPANIGSVSWSGDATLLAAVPNDGSSKVFVIDARTGKLLRTLEHNHPVRRAAFHPSEPLVVTSRGRPPSPSEANGPEEVRIWDARTGRLVKKLPGSFGAWSPDGTLIVATDSDVTKTFDTKNFWSLATVKGRATFAAFTKDSRAILTPITRPAPGARDLIIDEIGLELRDARTGLLILRMDQKVLEFGESRDSARLATLPALSWNEQETSASFFTDLWEPREKKTATRLVGSLHALRAPELWDAGRVLALRSRGMLRVDRITPRRTLWIAALHGPSSRCELAVFDERTGDFDGPAEPLLAFRRGDELREAALDEGPTLAQHRHPGLLRELFDGR